ncbi:GPW/gp25 family protein [Epilithonimonas hungarica]|jgi:Gene 25-like lysozyme.|uniref:Gene 25-like lysozyme n=1 Tax=Epilithonimonas hungarica TaxID=454006 RepID=A0A1G7INH6_9FLAO|nr:GPW/gp25 family protein [Epilithonimonas hungarica]MDP9956364.1 phage baseplate assembly protein W [Epilithonimonas hungarica]SDF14267.1 Gene 25-like lysozyme [Epilithonimonas hungarica]
MKGIYYKIPMDFEAMINKKDAEKISIDNSISQQIFLISTTALGECKFDETFGTEIWEMDFDLLKTDNSLKEFIVTAMKKAIVMHEKRLLLEDVEVSVKDHNLGTFGKRRMKKRVVISVKGQVLETNRPFLFQNSFFVGPLSY